MNGLIEKARSKNVDFLGIISAILGQHFLHTPQIECKVEVAEFGYVIRLARRTLFRRRVGSADHVADDRLRLVARFVGRQHASGPVGSHGTAR